MPEPTQPDPVESIDLVLELRAQWVIPLRASGESRWRFWMRQSLEFDQQQLLWERWRDTCKVYFTSLRAGGWTFEQVIVRDIFPQVLPDLVIPLHEVDGGDPEEQAPPGSTPVITWRSEWAGRSYRGRTFWGPIRWPDLTLGTYDHTLHVYLENFAETMLDVFQFGPITAYDPHFVIFSRQHNNEPDLPGRVAFVTHYDVPQYLGQQRRRQRYYNPP